MKGQWAAASEGCKCGCARGRCAAWAAVLLRWHGCWFHVIRWILGIAIIFFVFCFGMMIGELKGAARKRLRLSDDAYAILWRLCVSHDAERYGAQAGQQVAPAMLGGDQVKIG